MQNSPKSPVIIVTLRGKQTNSYSYVIHLYWEHAFDANNSYVVGELTWIQSHLFLITFLPSKRFY
ncbi:hypothetical protein PSFL107428_12400 [Pseudoalteromonas maricaloris]